MAGPTLRHRVLYVLKRVCNPGVLGLGGVGEDLLPRVFVYDHVLQHRPEADGRVYLGLLLLAEVYGLGVGPSLEVEDAVLGPAMLVVADEAALFVGGDGRLARAREPE